MYTKPVDAAKLILQKEEVESVEWFDMEELDTAFSRLEISDSASPRRASGLLNVGGRAENKS